MKPLSSTDTVKIPSGSHLRVVELDRANMMIAAQEMAQELLQDERDRWAYAIHDGLTQTVAAAILQIETLAQRVQRDPGSVIDDLDDTASEMRSVMADIRSVLFSLSAEGGASEPPAESVRSCVEEVAGRWKLDVDLDVTGDLLTVPRQTITIALVVIHEALTNAAKHTGSSARVRVDATRSFLRVVVTDEGPGLGENARRFGMRMMERRVNEAGGHLDVRSNPEGTSVAATFPIGDPR